MHFSFYSCNKEPVEWLLYIKDKYSLLYEPFCEDVGVSIMCGAYTSLDTICETGVVAHISGYNSKRAWINKNMVVLKSPKGYLVAHFDDSPMKGPGVDYDRTWDTYFDKSNDYICIGDYHVRDTDGGLYTSRREYMTYPTHHLRRLKDWVNFERKAPQRVAGPPACVFVCTTRRTAAHGLHFSLALAAEPLPKQTRHV